jgi:hypothetical protein
VLIIRNEQLESMQAMLKRRNPIMVARYLRSEAPEQVAELDEEALLERAKAILAVAEERYGIEVAWDQCRYALLEVLFGPEFDQEHAWARDLLAEPTSPTERVDQLEFYYVNYLREG